VQLADLVVVEILAARLERHPEFIGGV